MNDVIKENYQLLYGDCLERMKEIDDKSIDCIICDLPYGTTACKWDIVIPFDKLWEQYERIIKSNGVIALFGSEPFSSMLRMSNLKMYKYDLIWHKNTSGSFATAKKRPMKYHENISIFYKRQPIYNPQYIQYADSTKRRFKDGEFVNRSKQMVKSTNKIQNGISFNGTEIRINRGKNPESILEFKSVPNSNGIRLHPTQKPVELIEYLVKTYTNEGDLVLDNCMGSGTTGVACLNTNRRFIGIEMNDNYFKIACKRIKEEQSQLTLF